VHSEEKMRALCFYFGVFVIPSLLIPIEKLPERLNELPHDKSIACFYSSGTRSAWAYIYLFSKGFSVKWLAAGNEELADHFKTGYYSEGFKMIGQNYLLQGLKTAFSPKFSLFIV